MWCGCVVWVCFVVCGGACCCSALPCSALLCSDHLIWLCGVHMMYQLRSVVAAPQPWCTLAPTTGGCTRDGARGGHQGVAAWHVLHRNPHLRLAVVGWSGSLFAPPAPREQPQPPPHSARRASHTRTRWYTPAGRGRCCRRTPNGGGRRGRGGGREGRGGSERRPLFGSGCTHNPIHIHIHTHTLAWPWPWRVLTCP